MSRLAKKPITIPPKTEVTYSAGVITVKGPLGTLTKTFRPTVNVAIDKGTGTVQLTPANDSIATRAMIGTYVSHLKNMMAGVNKPYEKKLIVEGIGYKADIKGKDLVLALGFSHTITMPIPEGLTIKSEKNVVTITGIDCEKVGQFAADIRAKKKPEPYLGKGVRYSDEVIRRKQGKTPIERAKAVGVEIAKKAKAAKITKVVFDRSGYLYIGKIKVVADAAREGGLEF